MKAVRLIFFGSHEFDITSRIFKVFYNVYVEDLFSVCFGGVTLSAEDVAWPPMCDYLS